MDIRHRIARALWDAADICLDDEQLLKMADAVISDVLTTPAPVSGSTGQQDTGENRGGDRQRGRPRIVCLSGSMRFFDRMLTVAAENTAAGRIVLAPFSVVAPDDQDGEFKRMLDELHFRKIDMADEVIVVTVDGYIGESTRNEIAYAKKHGKPVWYEDFTPGQPDIVVMACSEEDIHPEYWPDCVPCGGMGKVRPSAPPVADSELHARVLNVITVATSGSRIAWQKVADAVMAEVAPVLAARDAEIETRRLPNDVDNSTKFEMDIWHVINRIHCGGVSEEWITEWAQAVNDQVVQPLLKRLMGELRFASATRQQYAEERDAAMSVPSEADAGVIAGSALDDSLRAFNSAYEVDDAYRMYGPIFLAEIERLRQVVRVSEAQDKERLRLSLRNRNREYGRASKTIGDLRGALAKAHADYRESSEDAACLRMNLDEIKRAGLPELERQTDLVEELRKHVLALEKTNERERAERNRLQTLLADAATALAGIADRERWEYPPSLKDRIEYVGSELKLAQLALDAFKAGRHVSVDMREYVLTGEAIGDNPDWFHEVFVAARDVSTVIREWCTANGIPVDTEASEQAEPWKCGDCKTINSPWMKSCEFCLSEAGPVVEVTPATPTEPRVWQAGDRQPDDVWKVRDGHGDVWTRNFGDSWESPDTMPCGWSYMAKKWAPLTEVTEDGSGSASTAEEKP